MKRSEHQALALHRGFTLAELVTTIVLISILAAVAIPNFGSVTDDAKKAKAAAIFSSLKTAYGVQKSIKKGAAVPVTDIVSGNDPSCSGAGMTQTCGNAVIVLSGSSTAVTAPANWTCTVNDVTPTTTACPTQ